MTQRKIFLTESTVPHLKLVAEETDDERFERTGEERRHQIENLLARLDMSALEKQFIVDVAEKMVDLVCDEYAQSKMQKSLTPQCISAAATVAMMIVYDS